MRQRSQDFGSVRYTEEGMASQRWNCGVCTFLNRVSCKECEMCANPRITTADLIASSGRSEGVQAALERRSAGTGTITFSQTDEERLLPYCVFRDSKYICKVDHFTTTCHLSMKAHMIRMHSSSLAQPCEEDPDPVITISKKRCLKPSSVTSSCVASLAHSSPSSREEVPLRLAINHRATRRSHTSFDPSPSSSPSSSPRSPYPSLLYRGGSSSRGQRGQRDTVSHDSLGGLPSGSSHVTGMPQPAHHIHANELLVTHECPCRPQQCAAVAAAEGHGPRQPPAPHLTAESTAHRGETAQRNSQRHYVPAAVKAFLQPSSAHYRRGLGGIYDRSRGRS